MLMQCQGASVKGRLAPVDLELHAGELVHLVGPNGAGKSTLLNVLAGLLPAIGDIRFSGQPLAQMNGAVLARMRAWLPQQQPAPGQMPVWHYLRMHLLHVNAEADRLLIQVLEMLGLKDKLMRNVLQLSGGEWQRVRLAAVALQIHPAINAQGKLLILDEPMSALDVAQQKAVDTLLAQLCAAGIAIVASGHDLNHSLRHADRVWLMHQSRLVAQGTAASVLTVGQLAPLYNIQFQRIETPQGALLLVP